MPVHEDTKVILTCIYNWIVFDGAPSIGMPPPEVQFAPKCCLWPWPWRQSLSCGPGN